MSLVEELAYAGLRWRPLSAWDLAAAAAAFAEPEVARWLCRPGETVEAALGRRAEREREGVSLLLVGSDPAEPRPRTLAGLSEYWELAALQTWSYVRHDLWGRGLNGVDYALVWALGREVLGRESLVVTIDERNERSVAAHRKLFPTATVELALEPWVPRRAVRLVVSEPPAGAAPLTAAELDALEALVRGLPATARWRVAAGCA